MSQTIEAIYKSVSPDYELAEKLDKLLVSTKLSRSVLMRTLTCNLGAQISAYPEESRKEVIRIITEELEDYCAEAAANHGIHR